MNRVQTRSKSTKLSGDLTCEINVFLLHWIYETTQVKILGWFLRVLEFKVLILFNYIFCFLSARRLYIYRAVASFFPTRRLKSQKNFCSQRCTNILGILTKNITLQRKIESLSLSDRLLDFNCIVIISTLFIVGSKSSIKANKNQVTKKIIQIPKLNRIHIAYSEGYSEPCQI